jgi:HSP20 family protein
MPGLIIWKNQEIDKLRRDMDRLFNRLWDDFGIPFFPSHERDVPSIDLSEMEDSLIVRAEIPGIDPEDLHITINDKILTIKGEMKGDAIHDSDEDYHRMERRHGYFSRVLELPCRVMIDEIQATYAQGLLTIMMPKSKQRESSVVKIRVG